MARLLVVKPQYRGTVLTIRSGLHNSMPFDVSFDTVTTDPQLFANLYESGFRDAFDVVDDASASEVIRTGYLLK